MITATETLKIVGRGTVVTSQPGTEYQSNMAAWVCALTTGRWLATYRAARDKSNPLQQTMVTWSDDDGRTWRKPFAPFPDRTVNGKIGQFRAMACTALGENRVVAAFWWVDTSDPSRPLFNPKTEGVLDSYPFISFSEDGGQSWSEPTLVNTAPFDQAPCVICGPVQILPNGVWALSYEIERVWDRAVDWHPGSAFSYSTDRGRTWNGGVHAARHPQNLVYYWDQRPSVLADGTLLDLFWTYDVKSAKYLNIHAAAARNGGRAWSPLWDTGIAGQPGPARSLPDGRLAMVYVDRAGAPSIKLRVSDDGGQTWPADTELLIHEAPLPSQLGTKKNLQELWNELGKYSVGLPDTKTLPSGDLLVTYYTGSHADQTDIEWARLSFQPAAPRPVAPLGGKRREK